MGELKNVRFIDPELNIKEILCNPLLEAVVTIKGNIILEAWFNEIPVFIFGKTNWGKLPGVYDLNNNKRLEMCMVTHTKETNNARHEE